MGTSTNQRSPNRPPWKPAQAVIGRTDVLPEHQTVEIWRAASFDKDTNIGQRLSDAVIANACAAAATAESPAQALRSYDAILSETRAAGLVFDLARRALLRSVAEKSGPEGFATELFAEAAGYYVSRDLPSYVGKPDRIRTASEIIELKKQIQTYTRSIVRDQALPKLSQATWSSYVIRVLEKLRGRKR